MPEAILNFKNSTFGKTDFNNIFIMKKIKYIFVLFVLTICIKKMPGVRSIAINSIRTTMLTS